MKRSKALVIVDASYFMYYLVYGAVAEFKKKASREASTLIRPAEETDQKNLPDLLVSDTFKRILKKFVMKRCETIDWQLRGHFQDELDCIDHIDTVFAMDDFTAKSFRKDLYPAYKAQRKFTPKQFDIFKIRNYVFDVIFKELELEDKYGYKFISVSGAEADDIIATIVNKCSDDYELKVLFASDHDFIQLEGINQLDLFGKEVVSKIGSVKVPRKDYLLGKILLGDGSDNIPKVFAKVGEKRVIGLINDKERLKKMLKENQAAAHQFKLNKKLIAFSEIPKKLSDKIAEAVNVALYSNDAVNDAGSFGNLEWL